MMTLEQGNHVALIAPASGQKQGTENRIEQAIDLLESWGLQVVIRPCCEAQGYLSASDELRGKDLREALTQPNIKAIFCTRGGYGCMRLLHHLDNVSVPNPRCLVGFSDITTLHLHFANTPHVRSIHGPNLATEQLLGNTTHAKANREALYQLLFQGTIPPLQTTPLFPESASDVGWQRIERIGGCLSLLVTSLGTDYAINTYNKVLMLEEVGESPYKLDRMLTHLSHAGQLAQAKAIVFGDMRSCHTPTIQASDVLKDIFAQSPVPVFMCQSFGHGSLNLPWVYGEQ